MGTRLIGPSKVKNTGRLSSSKNDRSAAFESLLERDFFTLLDFDLDVVKFHEQPVTIEYVGSTGEPRRYTPDVLVFFRQGSQRKRPEPTLYEVKPRPVLFSQWAVLKPKFRAARRYATAHGWRFKIVTEQEVHGAYLQNVQFLRQFRGGNEKKLEFADVLLHRLQQQSLSTPHALVTSLLQDPLNQARAIRSFWKLVAHHRIGMDLTQPISMESEIWNVLE